MDAVDQSFGIDVDYAMLIKHYGESADQGHERKYSPSVCTGCHSKKITGKPDAGHVSTSHVERLNLSVRMQNRRFTRLTNGHSKKIENHIHHLAIYFVFYNFARVPLHHDFADKAAVVDGEMIDVIGNMPLVRAFCGLGREHERFDATVDHEVTARQRSLVYLEKLRILHAVFTVVLTIGLLAWAIVLWQRGAATTGDVVLACTLSLAVLHATRDLAVALVV